MVYGMYGLLVLIWSSTWVAVSLFARSESAIRLSASRSDVRSRQPFGPRPVATRTASTVTATEAIHP